jgi:GH15 family glucan-1,4-alpha-glucosidase
MLAIGDHGLLADGLTSALIGRNGSVAWLCLPRFDSASAFATLLDPQAGHCRFGPRGDALGLQRYVEHTNVLVTEFPDARVTDWMPARFDGVVVAGFGDGALCRWAEPAGAGGAVELVCAPRLDYGRLGVRWRPGANGIWHADAPVSLWAAASFPLRAGDGAEAGSLSGAGDPRVDAPAWFVFGWGEAPEALDRERVRRSLADTTRCWSGWAAQGKYDGPFGAAVERSALALKALVYAPTGAIVAAPTTSLPEAIGGTRNWDYRYCWPRDATFALYGLSLLGYHDEAGRFLEFIAKIADANPPPLQVCYRVDGGTDLEEHELAHLAGYRNSRPVRIGNGAAQQRQLDIYGEVLDAAYTYARWRDGIEPRLWNPLARLVDYAAGHWREPDESIWEVRGGRQQFVYSKVLCWVALDRGIKLAQWHRLPAALARWETARAEIHAAVLHEGYNPTLHAFTQTFDNTCLDSSLLLMPLLRFCSPHEPRMAATIRRIQASLAKNSLLARYQNTEADGVGGPEGAFSICTFWMVDCLTLLGCATEARQLFEHMLGYASPLGLFSEEIDARSGTMLGNFPQAFTHMALLNSAHNLEIYPGGVA